VRTVGIADDDLDTVEFDGYQVIVEGIAVQEDGMAFLAHPRSELVHDPAHDAGKLMFGFLAHLDQLKPVETDLPRFVDGYGRHHLQRGRRGKSRTIGNIAKYQDIGALLKFYPFLQKLGKHPDGIVDPLLPHLLIKVLKFYLSFKGEVQRSKPDTFPVGFPQEKISAETQRTGKYKSSVVIGMLADQVHPSRGKKTVKLPGTVPGNEFFL